MVKNSFSSDLEKLNEVIANESIFHSVVTKLGGENDNPYMSVQIGNENGLGGGYVGRIYIDESDDEMHRRSLMPLLNQVIPFVIIGVDAEHSMVICSRKRAQQQLKRNMAQAIADKKVFTAKIVKFMPFGAFVDINGVSGVLRTTDFSTDHSEIPEYYSIGDNIRVICSDISENGRMSFRAEKMHERQQPLTYDIEKDQVVLGEIRSIRSFDRGPVAFVHIATGLDCLCPMPNEIEIERGENAAVRIVEVRKSDDEKKPPFVRGRIIRVY